MPSYVSSAGESDFTPIPPGTYVGRCYQVINLGLQAAGPWAPKNKHYIAFEIPTERVTWTDKEGKEQEGPAVIGSRYTSSLSPKANLRQHLETWRGALFTDVELANFDLFNLIGVPAMISVTHSEDGKYANISGIVKMVQGMVCAPAELPPIAYDPTDPQGAAVFAKLTTRMQETVRKGQLVAEAPQPAPMPAHQALPGHQVPSALLRNGAQPPAYQQPAAGVQDFDDDIPF